MPPHDLMSACPAMGDGLTRWSPRELKRAMALVGKVGEPSKVTDPTPVRWS